MSWREQLEQAIALAHPRCLECGNDRVTVEWRPDLQDWIPVSHHWARTVQDSCPVLSGGVAAWQCHNDLWDALERHLVVGDFGEVAWARRQLVAA